MQVLIALDTPEQLIRVTKQSITINAVPRQIDDDFIAFWISSSTDGVYLMVRPDGTMYLAHENENN